MRSLRIALVAPLALIACGDNSGQQQPPDARMIDSKMVDAAVPACQYTEANDVGNDDLFGSGSAETTNLQFTNSKVTVCGNFDTGHYDSATSLIDSDTFKVHVPAMQGAKLTLSAAGAENLNTVLVEVYDMVSGTDGIGTFIGNHAAASADLVPGDYTITVSAFHTAAPSAAIAYHATLTPYDRNTACPHQTGTASYTEAGDGATADGNDVLQIHYSSTPHGSLTTNPVDVPEDTSTAFTVAPAMNYRVTGTAANPTVTPADWGDAYKERDTYAIKTGTANEVTLRVDWPSTDADFDMLTFKEGGTTEFADAYAASKTVPEFLTLALAPDTTYWVFVGSATSSTLPATYDLSICGATFTP